MASILVLMLLVTSWWVVDAVDSENGPDNGFGDKYKWAPSLHVGLAYAKETRKPTMLIVHKSWCGACKSLKPRFAESRELLALSEYFVMINAMDDDEPTDEKYAPDGSYIPRILFITSEGEVLNEIYNEEGSEKHKYFYNRPEQIAAAMKKMLTISNIKPVKSDVSEGNEEL